ncbi:hypothetical protein LTR78_003168 [Recurvomyces mirabilis]|uniref:AB hydrolase-1 domain-containing protein n=1 Tax=Recurvomyces mirabilis TaxID=574656 RepID=A0AAE0WSD6_9PEZI|nr:hypothetical protein LTR78_003168 [Recurvomyces mirabilis]KAK5157011.1 hypothetical protein LTS14_004528 [Recurvomyces mirabilis]
MKSSQVTTQGGISWYVEEFFPTGNALEDVPPIVLIPSGEGDCHNLRELGGLLGNAGFHAFSFDMPGFSRTTAPVAAYSTITAGLLASQIISLLDELHVSRAAFFGCSSGGLAMLALVALYPERVHCGMVHEVPFEAPPQLLAMTQKSDDEVSANCEYFFANYLIEQTDNDGRAKWEALGSEYHARLKRNYVTWVRHYVGQFEAHSLGLAAKFQQRPVFWTVGGLSDPKAWSKDWEVATTAGVSVSTDVLPCLHFPAVTVTKKTRDWISGCVVSVKPQLGEGVSSFEK